jgi:hypothetical protein
MAESGVRHTDPSRDHTNLHHVNTVPDDSASESTTVEHTKFEPIRREPTIEDYVNLPIRSLSNEANLDEYTQETIDGQMLREVRSNVTGHIERYELVTFKIDDPENPKNWSKAYKWWCTMCGKLLIFFPHAMCILTCPSGCNVFCSSIQLRRHHG